MILTLGHVLGHVELPPGALRQRIAAALTGPDLEAPRDNPPVCLLKEDGAFPIGLAPRVLELLMAQTQDVRNGFPVGELMTSVPVTLRGMERFVAPWTCDVLPEHILGAGITPRADQIAAWLAIRFNTLSGLPFPHGIIQAATATGKTVVAALVAKTLAGNVLVTCSKKELSWQLQADLSQLLGEEVGLVQGSTVQIRRVTVAMIQTIRAGGGVEYVFENIPFAGHIWDECHHAVSPKWRTAMEGLCAPVVVGLSGTPWRDDKPLSRLLVEGFCGPRLVRLTPGEAIAKGITAPVHVHYVPVQVPRYVMLYGRSTFLASVPWVSRRKGNHPCGYSFAVIDNEERNAIFVALAKASIAAGDLTLVLVTSVRHGNDLASRLNAPFLDGTTADAIRKDTMAQFRAGTLRCVVATTIWDEGINVRAIGALYLAGAGRTPIGLLQRIGRGARKDDDKVLQVYDSDDIGHPVAAKHSRERRSICVEAGYQVS